MISRRTLSTALASLAALGLATDGAAQSNTTTYISIGDSLAAGFSSGSLVETNQAGSVPALIARQSSLVDFQQPLVTEPGIPAQLALLSLVPGPVIGPKSTSLGVPKNLNLPRPYNNLAVPGATAEDALKTVHDPDNPFFDLVLRGLASQVAQAVASRPTFISLWIGNNDVLTAAVRGRAIDGVTLTPPDEFRTTYTQIVAALRTTGAGIVAANLPDVTQIPFVTTIKPYVVNPATGQPVLINGNTVPLIGPGGPLPSNAFITLPAQSLLAQGIGVPAALGGTGQPLPDEVVLDAGEVAVIRDHVNQDNQAIRDICQAAGIHVLDVNALLSDLAENGRSVGGVQLSNAFLTGGIFSYDGVHPSALGYAVIANEWIATINDAGGHVLPLDLSPFLGTSAASVTAKASARPTPASFSYSPEAYQSLLAAFPLLHGKSTTR
jgi:lysophospholipase L1-like esterase